MTVTRNDWQMRQEQGFAAYVLRNEVLEIAVVPELGARIISLKNLRTGREWLWRPPGPLALFTNRPGDDFSCSPLVGVDECLPTIAPCSWQGRKLPDHGEVWAMSWSVDDKQWQNGIIKTAVKLNLSPLEFERTIQLHGDEIRLDYRLTNRSAIEERFVWAIHPLMKLESGDHFDLPASTRSMLGSHEWIRSLDSTVLAGKCSKVFAGPVTEGWAGIGNSQTGDWLKFEWNPAENNMLGLWLTRGGWHGHHHVALEPTNSAADPLDLAVEQGRCGSVAGSGTALWQIRLRVGP